MSENGERADSWAKTHAERDRPRIALAGTRTSMLHDSLSSTESNKPSGNDRPLDSGTSWTAVELLGVCIARFRAGDDNLLDLKIGDQVKIDQSSDPWYIGRNLQTGRTGCFPSSFVSIVESLRDYEADADMDEINLVFQEWSSLLRSYYSTHKLEEFRILKDGYGFLLEAQTELDEPTLSDKARRVLQKKMLAKIEEVRRRLQLDVVVRTTNGETATLENTTLMALLQLHQGAEAQGITPSTYVGQVDKTSFKNQATLARHVSRRHVADSYHDSPASSSSASLSSSSSSLSLSPTLAAVASANKSQQPPEEQENTFQLVVALAAFLCPIREPSEVYLSVWHRPTNHRITNEWHVDMSAQGMPVDQSKIGNMAALFRDLDLDQLKSNHLFLLIRIVRRGEVEYDMQELRPGGGTATSASSSSSIVSIAGSSSSSSSSSSASSSSSSSSVSSSSPSSPSSSSGMLGPNDADEPPANGSTTAEVRRPFAVGLLPLSSALSTEESTTTVAVWSCPDNLFYNLPELILRHTEGVKKVEKARGVIVSITAHYLPFAAAAGNPVLAAIRPVVRVLGYRKLMEPEENRHEFFLTLSGCEVGLAGKRTAKNIQLQVTVRKNSNGELVPNCFKPGIGEHPINEFRSFVIYHSNNPTWRERIQITVDPHTLHEAHVFITFHHVASTNNRPQAPFGMTFFRLCDAVSNAVVLDGMHTLVVYKYNRSVDDPTFYLKGVESGVKLLPRGSKGDSLFIKTELVSFVLTQNPQLRALLHWRKKLPAVHAAAQSTAAAATASAGSHRNTVSHNSNNNNNDDSESLSAAAVEDDTEAVANIESARNLTDVLRGLSYVDAFEVIKFTRPVFDALVEIFELRPLSLYLQCYHDAFDAFCFAINSLINTRFSTGYQSIIMRYLSAHFMSASMHRALLLTLTSVFFNAERDPSRVVNAMKVMEHLLLFIMASRQTYNAAKGVALENDHRFKQALLGFFICVNRLLLLDSPKLIGAQTLAIKRFPFWFDELSKPFLTVELAGIVSKFLESIPLSNKRQRNLEKLTVIRILAFGRLFTDSPSRRLMMPTLLDQLIAHMQRLAAEEDSSFLDQLDECSEILAAMLDQAETEYRETKEPGAICDLAHLLPSLMDAIEILNGRPEAYVPTAHRFVAAFLAILYLLPSGFLVKFVEQQKSPSRFLLRFFSALNTIIASNEIRFPEKWLTLCLFEYQTLHKLIVRELPCAVHKRLVPLASDINATELRTWVLMFRFIFSFLHLPLLSLERLSVAKQQLITDKLGDLRVSVCQELLQSWHAVVDQNHHSHFTTHLLGDFLRLILVPKDEIRQAGIEMYFTAIKSEFEQTGFFADTEKLTITSFDILANSEDHQSHWFDSSFTQFFISQLELQFDKSSIDRSSSTRFISEVRELLGLMVALRTLPHTPEYEDERTIATMKLMEYLRQTDRTEAYVKYVDGLVAEHEAGQNYIEAGCTLRLHADLISWSGPQLPAMHNYSEASSFARKEALYKRAIEFFDQGKAWEYAIQYSRELLHEYETQRYDYLQAAEQLELQSRFFRSCLEEHRFFSEYFRVGYYGQGFPSHIQNRAFIYRGFELERLGEFVQRIQKRYPSASLLTYTDAPPDDLLKSERQWLQIFTVRPVSKLSKAELLKMPLVIQEYHTYNNVSSFLYSKPFRRPANPGSESQNEFEDLWIANHTFTTADSFPTIHRRSEILRTDKSELNPLEHAIQQVEQKTTELQKLIIKYSEAKDSNISPFTMVLTGAIDAAVSGGTENYRKAFFTPDYEARNPQHQALIVQLKSALFNQLQVLQEALSVHGEVCPANMYDLQTHLETKLKLLKTAE